MSGTSVDGTDAVLVKGDAYGSEVVEHIFQNFPESLDQELLNLQQHPYCALKTLGQLDHRLGESYAQVVQALLDKAGVQASQIKAIGSHGQTIYHSPQDKYPFSIQIGDPNIIAARTGIPVVADFRRMDIAYGGDGAPLAPILHQVLFSSSDEMRVVVNLGGIANMTILNPIKPVVGFDNGPANCLMDCWIQHFNSSLRFDDKGEWAASGQVDETLLNNMLNDAYFKLSPPKSTGKELFNMVWLKSHIDSYSYLSPESVQATLCELTATSIANDMMQYAEEAASVYICGGGANNNFLMQRLRALLPSKQVKTTHALGIPVEQVEATAFAWLARCRMEQKLGNIPSVTGATRQAYLGGVYLPN